MNKSKLQSTVETLIGCLGLGLLLFTWLMLDVTENATAQPKERPEFVISALVDYEFPTNDYQGEENLKAYWDEVLYLRSELGLYQDKFVEEGFDDFTDEVITIVSEVGNSTNLEEMRTAKDELDALLSDLIALREEEKAQAAAATVYYAPKQSYSDDQYIDGVLTPSGGVNWYNGRKETWYSQRVLPGGGLNIPGRHVASDGTIRDGDGYIVVAASDTPYGTVVDTSLGQGKVYDTGCAAGTNDIYTDW